MNKVMRYKVDDRVKIKSLDWYNENKSKSHGTVACGGKYFDYDMKEWCGKIMTILTAYQTCYIMEEDGAKNLWTDEMIEGLIEPIDCKKCGLTRMSTRCLFMDNCPHNQPKHTIEIPKGWILKDENDNIINSKQIVLEKKKDINLTQEQINTIIRDSCVLFCKHCGCGIPRDTCTSLGTCKEHDEYRDAIRTHLIEGNKREYPKTYEECAEIIAELTGSDCNPKGCMGYMSVQLTALQKLLICRNAYWKIAGDEMELGEPWEPDYIDKENTEYSYYIFYDGNNFQKGFGYSNIIHRILMFPREEMRDAFYENFKGLIESVKEFL